MCVSLHIFLQKLVNKRIPIPNTCTSLYNLSCKFSSPCAFMSMLYWNILMVLSLEPVASRSPMGLQATQ